MSIVVVVFILVLLVGCGLVATWCLGSEKAVPSLDVRPQGRVLVVCYSESKTKSTLTAARWIAEMTGADLLEIVPAEPYPESYAGVLKVSYRQIKDKVAPPLKPLSCRPADYDLVFIGTPVWFGTFAPPIRTFLTENDLAGKKLVPFCTHGGGGASRTFQDIGALVPACQCLPGLALRGPNFVQRKLGKGTSTLASPVTVRDWLLGLDLGWRRPDGTSAPRTDERPQAQ